MLSKKKSRVENFIVFKVDQKGNEIRSDIEANVYMYI